METNIITRIKVIEHNRKRSILVSLIANTVMLNNYSSLKLIEKHCQDTNYNKFWGIVLKHAMTGVAAVKVVAGVDAAFHLVLITGVVGCRVDEVESAAHFLKVVIF